MEDFLNFFINIGKLNKIPRRGWKLIGVKNPQTIGEHMFRVAIMTWILGKERKINFDMERSLKMALIHDLCELHAGDITPYDYDSILPKDKKKWPRLFDKWPRFSKSEKIKYFLEKHKKERVSLEKLISGLPPAVKKEILALWLSYEQGLTKEARFVKQVNRVETLLQALEYGKESKTRPYKSWWVGSEEKVDDPLLLKFMKALEKKFHRK